MRPSSKQWLFAGLALVAGIGMVRLLNGPRVTRGMRVLLVGDSLAVGLGPLLGALAKESGVTLKVLAKEGTRIDQWAASAELKTLLESFKPELVLVSLGTNDAFMKGADVVAKQKLQLDKLLEVLTTWPRSKDYGLGPDHVVWIGPPTLPSPPSPGMVTMIQDGSGSALSPRYHYFHSDRLQIPRVPDKIHPTARGYAGWAGALWHWLS